jgi:transcriptional regulator with XRE-family HTH domain
MNAIMGETLKDLRIDLGWTQSDLATAADVSKSVVSQAESGQRIMPKKAKAIADAFSNAYGREIKPSDIEGLNVR